MKYLVLFGVLLVVYLIWRHQRRGERDDASARKAKAPPATAQEIVACSVCQVHLPRAEALVDPRGRLYCCAEHRQKDTV